MEGGRLAGRGAPSAAESVSVLGGAGAPESLVAGNRMRTQDMTEAYGDWPAVTALVEDGVKPVALLRELYAEFQRRSPGFEGPSIDLFREMTGYPATQKLAGTGQILNNSFWGLKRGLQQAGKLAVASEQSGRRIYRVSPEAGPEKPPSGSGPRPETPPPTWRYTAMEAIRKLDSREFEHLVAAWAKVVFPGGDSKVTKPVGDRGFDVVVSFPPLDAKVRIEAKLWNTGVGSPEVLKLRGALKQGDKGYLIALGGFTKQAVAEARAKNKAQVKLVGGNELLDDMKEHRLGIRVEMVEEVTVDPDWFRVLKEQAQAH